MFDIILMTIIITFCSTVCLFSIIFAFVDYCQKCNKKRLARKAELKKLEEEYFFDKVICLVRREIARYKFRK